MKFDKFAQFEIRNMKVEALLISFFLTLSLATKVDLRLLDPTLSCTLIMADWDNSSESLSPMLKWETLESMSRMYYDDFCAFDCRVTQNLPFKNALIGNRVSI